MSKAELHHIFVARRGAHWIRLVAAMGNEGRDERSARVIWGFAPRERGAAILEQMALRKTVDLRRLGGDRGGGLRACRFFASGKVTAAKIIEGGSARTGAAASGRHVLAIQDSNEVAFPTTAQRRRGLGPVKKGNADAVLVHAMIAIDAPTGACLELVGGEVSTRAGVAASDHHAGRCRSASRSVG